MTFPVSPDPADPAAPADRPAIAKPQTHIDSVHVRIMQRATRQEKHATFYNLATDEILAAITTLNNQRNHDASVETTPQK